MLLLLALSFVLPTLLGWLVVQSVWRSSPWRIGIGLALILGTAITGTVHFLILSLSDSTTITFAAAEAVLAALIVVLCIYLRRTPEKWSHRTYSRDAFGWGFEVVAVLSGIAVLLICDAQRHGGWDAVAMWNLKARLILTSAGTPVQALVDPAFSGLHPDYPLLLPALVARGWRYIGGSAPIVPILLAGWFALVAVVVTTAGVEAISTSSQGWVAGSLLVSTPLLINVAASQYADIVVCCFITAAVVLYCIHDSMDQEHGPRHLPILAGIAAAAAACTKNEGILFLAVLLAARIILGITERRGADTARELVSFAIGASAGLIALAIFKFAFSPPNDTVRLVSVHAAMSRLSDGHSNREIFSRFRSALMFGAWYLNPLPVMALHTTIVYSSSTERKSRPWFTPAFVLVAMMCGYYVVYLFSPYDLESHLASSLDRLVLQLWPTALLLYSCLVAPKHAGLVRSERRHVVLRVAAAAAIVAVTFALYFGRTSTAVAVGGIPHIELSRAEVMAGQSYSIKITGIKGPQVYVSYSIDGKPMGQFGAYLGEDETVTFELSEGTPKGTYQFNAVRNADNPGWVVFDDPAKLVVK
jgi:hypothetical protein